MYLHRSKHLCGYIIIVVNGKFNKLLHHSYVTCHIFYFIKDCLHMIVVFSVWLACPYFLGDVLSTSPHNPSLDIFTTLFRTQFSVLFDPAPIFAVMFQARPFATRMSMSCTSIHRILFVLFGRVPVFVVMFASLPKYIVQNSRAKQQKC